MVANLLESLVFLVLLLLVCALLPGSFLRDHFVVRGTILAMGIIGSLMAFVKFHMQFGIDSGLKLLIAPLAVWLLTTLLLIFPAKFRLSDRMLVFLYILVPLFVLLLGYVIFRNIL